MACEFVFSNARDVRLSLNNPARDALITAQLINIITEALGLGAWLPSPWTENDLRTMVEELLQDTPLRRRNQTKLDCHANNVSDDVGCGCKSVDDARADFEEWERRFQRMRRDIIHPVPGPCQRLSYAMQDRMSAFHDCARERTEANVFCKKSSPGKRCREATIVKVCVAKEGEVIPKDSGTFTASRRWWEDPLLQDCQYCAKDVGDEIAAAAGALNVMLIAGENFSQMMGCGTTVTRIQQSLNRCEYIKQTVGKIVTAGECPKKCIAWRYEPGYKWVPC